MAKVLKSNNEEFTHLRGVNLSVCGKQINGATVEEDDLTCSECAEIALVAIELTTKVERREWRKLCKK